ncbi:MAG: hypothetical protein DRP12_02045 [Candidatus Aenigmatarchaeota archaeon]|nr:MAG: hypothetical protein DRP12_02045 [Candidatus Aenigmarchaeota archaeon]
MKIVTGYSVWIIPPRDIRRKLSQIMNRLSKEFKAPKITFPHVTLIEGLLGNEEELKEKAEKLARSMRPFRIRLTEIEKGKHFGNLVILAEGRGLENAYLKAEKIFGEGHVHKPFHLTLLLKDISQKQRQEILSKIGRKFDLEFEAKSLYLVPIGKRPERWLPVKRFKI